MIIDALLMFDSASAITASAASQVSANVIDLGVNRDMGVGSESEATPKLLILCTTAFATTNSGTLNVQFQGAPDNGGVPGTYTTFAESGVLAALPTGGQRVLQIDVPRPQGNDLANRPRFLRLNYVVGVGVFSTGALSAFIVLGRDDLPAYPPGVVVAN